MSQPSPSGLRSAPRSKATAPPLCRRTDVCPGKAIYRKPRTSTTTNTKRLLSMISFWTTRNGRQRERASISTSWTSSITSCLASRNRKYWIHSNKNSAKIPTSIICFSIKYRICPLQPPILSPSYFLMGCTMLAIQLKPFKKESHLNFRILSRCFMSLFKYPY